MKEFEVAFLFEQKVEEYLEREVKNSTNELKLFLELLLEQQKKLIILFKDYREQAFLEVNIEHLSIDESSYANLVQSYANRAYKDMDDFILLAICYSMFEQLATYYSQAATHNPYPNGKMFYASISHIKHGVRRRIGGLSRIFYNSIWEKVGFPPYNIES